MKGATNLKGYGFPPKYDFNPRTREGCDLRLRKRWEMIRDDFNPRNREGCDVFRRHLERFVVECGHFNPRTREGCDLFDNIGDKPEIIISIHAPVKGATVAARVSYIVFHIFQSTHP